MAKDPRASACEIAAADIDEVVKRLEAMEAEARERGNYGLILDIAGIQRIIRCLPECLRAAARD